MGFYKLWTSINKLEFIIDSSCDRFCLIFNLEFLNYNLQLVFSYTWIAMPWMLVLKYDATEACDIVWHVMYNEKNVQLVILKLKDTNDNKKRLSPIYIFDYNSHWFSAQQS